MSGERLAMLEELLARGSEDPFHHYARAMELRSLGRLEEALGAFGEVRDRFPRYVPTYLMAAQLAAELDDREAARDWARQGVVEARTAGETKARSELEDLLATLEG